MFTIKNWEDEDSVSLFTSAEEIPTYTTQHQNKEKIPTNFDPTRFARKTVHILRARSWLGSSHIVCGVRLRVGLFTFLRCLVIDVCSIYVPARGKVYQNIELNLDDYQTDFGTDVVIIIGNYLYKIGSNLESISGSTNKKTEKHIKEAWVRQTDLK